MKRYRVKPGQKVDLKDFDPSDSSGFKGGKEAAYNEMLQLTKELITLQELLYAEHRHKVLIVLQAMDTGGKDGTIRHVFEGVNPQGVHVAGFKEPTPLERDHDYLWRIHQQMPENGEINLLRMCVFIPRTTLSSFLTVCRLNSSSGVSYSERTII